MKDDDHILDQADEAWQRNDRDSDHDQQRQSPEGSEDWLALELVRLHGDKLRILAETKSWVRWDDIRWVDDGATSVFDLVRPLVRKFAASLETTAQARRAATAAVVAGVERLARSDGRLKVLARAFDADPFVLNTPAGLVDLQTGTVRPHDPLAYCTKLTAVGPAEPSCSPPRRWLQFLGEITNGDQSLIAFLQRIAGYSLTGDISEHALFFGYGTGANGKSVFVNTLARILGDYATAAPAEVFLASQYDRHPTEVADLRGARLVVVSEIDNGRRWNEARIKSVTGGDPIKARFMRQDFFEFRPQFKPLIVGNHRPNLQSVDEAIRHRLHLLPFNVTIPADQRDRDLPDKLKDEWPAILRWAIDGCLEWRRMGLAPPAVVVDATGEYLADEDAFGQWLQECCQLDPNAWTATQDLFASWKAWADRSGETTGSEKAFAEALTARGIRDKRTAKKRGRVGLRLVS